LLAQIKYRLLGLKGLLYLLGLQLVASLASHLLGDDLPRPWPGVMLAVWLVLSFFPYVLVLTEVFTARKAFGHVLYWQTPLPLSKLVGAQLVVVFAVALPFMGSWVHFALFSPVLMPQGVTALAAANLVIMGLHVLAWAVAFMLLFAGRLTIRHSPIALLAFLVALASMYWLNLRVPVSVLQFLMAPFTGSWPDQPIWVPWSLAWQNAGQVLAVVALQFGLLLYVMTHGKADCPESD